MNKTLDISVKHITVNVTALARQAGLSEAVAQSPALLRFAEQVVDMVMREHGAVRADAGESEN